jgi:hypothetical protein
MQLAAWLEVIKGVLAFPKEVLAIVRLFQKTPEEKHQDLVAAIQKEAAVFQETGRPSW